MIHLSKKSEDEFQSEENKTRSYNLRIVEEKNSAFA
jgi:hypothetical protein